MDVSYADRIEAAIEDMEDALGKLEVEKRQIKENLERYHNARDVLRELESEPEEDSGSIQENVEAVLVNAHPLSMKRGDIYAELKERMNGDLTPKSVSNALFHLAQKGRVERDEAAGAWRWTAPF